MEKGFYFLVGCCLILVGLFIGGLNKQTEKVTIDLPEEYKEINDSTNIVGRYNKQTKVLTIEFKHDGN